MKRSIISFGGYFEAFIETLNGKERLKVDYLLTLLRSEDRMPVKFLKNIKDELYELRIEYSSNIFRVFLVFDENRVVVLLSGFRKKTRKTPFREIEKAIRIMQEYYEYKRN